MFRNRAEQRFLGLGAGLRRQPFQYGDARNGDARLAEWQDVLADTRELPAVLRAAILLEAWSEIEVLQHAAWLGPLLVAALLRQEGLGAAISPHCISAPRTFRGSAGAHGRGATGCRRLSTPSRKRRSQD
jgi:hypothetical protein